MTLSNLLIIEFCFYVPLHVYVFNDFQVKLVPGTILQDPFNTSFS